MTKSQGEGLTHLLPAAVDNRIGPPCVDPLIEFGEFFIIIQVRLSIGDVTVVLVDEPAFLNSRLAFHGVVDFGFDTLVLSQVNISPTNKRVDLGIDLGS